MISRKRAGAKLEPSPGSNLEQGDSSQCPKLTACIARHPQARPSSRRRFLTNAAGVAAGGTVLALATVFGHGRRRGTYGRPVVLWRRYNLRVDRRVPGGREGALVILDLLRELTVTFLHVDMPEPAKAADTTLLGDLSASAMEIPTPPRDHIPLGGVVRRGAGRSDGARPSLDCNSSRSVKTSA